MVILFSDLPTNENTFVALTTPGINVSTITEEQGMKCFTRQTVRIYRECSVM